jgi:hypothetical protein
MLLNVRIGDTSTEIEIWILFACEMPKLVSVLFQDVDEDLYDKRGGNYDVKFKIWDVGVIQNLLKSVRIGIRNKVKEGEGNFV